jgi:hypothetical protein
MLRMAYLAVAVLILTAAGCDDAPTPAQLSTYTPTTRALPMPTATPTSAPKPFTSFPAACEIKDPAFCDLATAVDKALRAGDVEFIVRNTVVQSVTCPPDAGVGPCARADEGEVLRGYFVGAAHTDGGYYISEAAYHALLEEAGETNATATDEYGDGTWRLVAVIDHQPESKSLVSTTIGPDPIYEIAQDERRAFTWNATRQADGWRLGTFLTYVVSLTHEPLTGISFQEEPIEGWAPWESDEIR